jgi:hypothetical protein
MPDQTDVTYPNVRAAVCALRGWPEAEFTRRIFLHAVPWYKRPLVALVRLTSPAVFAADLGIVDGFGDVNSNLTCSVVLAELHGVNRLERGFRRGTLRLRIKGNRLQAIWERVRPYIAEPEAEKQAAPKAETGPRRPAGEPGQAPLQLRRLRQYHADVTGGVAPAEALRKSGFATEEELLKQLAAHGAGHPALLWLHELLRHRDTRADLAAENERLRRALGEQSAEIANLRARLESTSRQLPLDV